MLSWQEQAEVGPWWVAFEQEVNDAERARIKGMPISRLPIYWYAGGPYQSRAAAEAALIELGDRRYPNGVVYFTSGYVVISCGQLENLTTPPPQRDWPAPRVEQTTLEQSRVRGFPNEAKKCLGWFQRPVQELERPHFRTPRKMRDP